jgi:NADH dehydrogenase
MMSGRQQSRRIVIVGGGVAGIEIATALGRRRKRNPRAPSVLLIDRDSSHVWKPMLHTIAAGTRDISQQQTPYIAQARQAGFEYQPGEMCGLDRNIREISLAPLHAVDGRLLVPARRVPYDILIISIGSEANDFATPGVQQHCFKIDSRLQADAFNHEVRISMLQCLSREQDLPIAIVGGGATGVELAAELVQLAEVAETYGAHTLASRTRITLIESGPRLLAAFPEDISLAARTRLEELGIRVMTQARVRAASSTGFELADGTEVRASLRVWAAGVKAPAFLAGADGLEVTPNNQLVVLPSLQTTQDPAIFAIGDCASLTLPDVDRPLAPTAQVAHQQAQHLIRHISRMMADHEPIPDFAYREFGSLVSLSEYDAYGSLGKLGIFKGTTIRGKLAQLSHAMLYRSHQARLFGFWRGGLIWLIDVLNRRLRSTIRLD